MLSSIVLLILISPFGTIAQRQRVSRDGSCAGLNGITCIGSIFGDCCSQYGFCGSSTLYCDKGCNPKFGTCNVPKPSAAQQVSTDSRCGPSFGSRTCLGSQFGNCCSRYSYCGSSQDYCEVETCQKGYGSCGPASSSKKPVPSLSASIARTSTSSVSKKVLTPVLSPATTASTTKSTSTSLSSTPRLSSSPSGASPLPSSSYSSTSASASPEPACFSVPGCTPVTTSLFDCNASKDQCQSGFQAKCGQMPTSGSVVISKTPSNPEFNQACLQLCAGDGKCVGFDNNAFPNTAGVIVWSCTLYSKITGVSQGWGTTHLKVCNSASNGPSIGSSSTASTGSTPSNTASSSSFSASQSASIVVSSPGIASSSDIVPSSVAVSTPPAATPTPPTCSDFRGADYFSNGQRFILSCYARSASEQLIRSEPQPSFTSCLDACTQVTGCRIASYNVNPNDPSYHICFYYQATTRGTDFTADYSSATLVSVRSL